MYLYEELSWDSWREALQTSKLLSDLGRSTASRIADSFRTFFGDKVISNPEHVLWNISVAGLSPLNESPQVFYRLLNVFAHIEILKSFNGLKGFHKWVPKLAYSPSDKSWRHLIMQMELAGFAARYSHRQAYGDDAGWNR